MKEDTTTGFQIKLRAYSKKEIARLYEITPSTLRKWLLPFEKELGERIGHLYNPKQVKIIFEKLGTPEILQFNH